MKVPANLTQIADQVKKGKQAQRMTVRGLLKNFGTNRRGTNVVREIRQQLQAFGLDTLPPFENVDMDSPVSFVLLTTNPSPKEVIERKTVGTTTDRHAEIRDLIRDVLKAEFAKANAPEPEALQALTLEVSDGTMIRWQALKDELAPKPDNEIFTSMLDLFTVRGSLTTKPSMQMSVRRTA